MKNWIIVLLSVLSFQACIDQEFDEPPFLEILEDAPEVTTTIAELKAMHVFGTFVTIEEDIVIKGTISADDESGNLFRRIVMQDESGAIELNINAVELHNFFPEGREIFIRCNGLVLGDFAGIIGIGGSIGMTGAGDPRLNGIEESLIDQFIVRGTTGNEVVPELTTIDELGPLDVSKLVQIENLEFEDSELGKTFADFQENTNRFLETCDGDEILIRTSGFSNFFNEELPTGNGTLIGIYTVFNDTRQMIVRRPEEVAFAGPRCDGTGGGSGGGGVDPVDLPEATTTIAELKSTHSLGSFTTINSNDVLRAVVTADDRAGNFFREIIIQDGSAGIELLVNERDLAADFGLEIGREIAINLNGLILNDFAGNISLGGNIFTNNSGTEQLGGIEPTEIGTSILIGDANMNVAPKSTTIEDLGDDDIHSLVRLDGIQFSDGNTGVTYADVVNNFSQNLDLEDCEGNTIIIRSSNFADFADALTPDGNGSITAIYSVFNDSKQLFIRDLGDIDMNGSRCDGTGGGGGSGGTGGVVFNEDFQNAPVDQLVDLQGWVNFAEAGSQDNSWFIADFNDNSYAQVSAFQSTDASNINWLISPAVEISSTASLSFMMGQCHWVQDGISVLISDNFSGDPTTATWVEVNANLPTANDDFWAFVPSGLIMLEDYFSSGEVNIAFRYEGSAPNDETTTFILDDIVATN